MRKTFLVVGIGVWLAATLCGAPAAAGDAAGADLFAEHKCATCHSIAAEGIEAKVKIEKMKGPDLGGYTTETKAAELFGYMTQASMLGDSKHKKKFTGTADELDVILAWVKTLEAAPAD